MRISILTFDGFNEIDSLLAFSILNRVQAEAGDWAVSIAAPTPTVTLMNGLELVAQCDLMEGCRADVVLVGSGTLTRDHVRNHEVMEQIQLDPQRQLIGAQCSGTLMLATLGLLALKSISPYLPSLAAS
jgi:transcriptional regulator GlxA family with amidase domain